LSSRDWAFRSLQARIFKSSAKAKLLHLSSLNSNAPDLSNFFEVIRE
jgi:hypothetical protein